MISKLFTAALAVSSVLGVYSAPALAATVTLDPVAAGGLRTINDDDPFTIDFLSIINVPVFRLGDVEDRGILEFDLSQVSGSPGGPASLILELRNLDSGPPNGSINLYTYAGNGAVDLSDYAAGTLLSSFVGPDPRDIVNLDVTSAFQAALEAEQPYLGFRFTTSDRDRYDSLYTNFGEDLRSPTLEVVPEPSACASVVFAAVGGVLLARRRLRRSGAVRLHRS